MKRLSTIIGMLTALATFTLCLLTASAQETGTKKALSEDEAAIRENVKQMEAGWNTKRGELFARPFAEDADYVIINGMYIKGRAVIEKAHQQIFDTVFKNTTINLSIKQIRFLRPDVAVVHVGGHRNASENEKELVTDAFITMVMVRDKQGWKIAAFQNTQVVANQR